MTRLWNLYLAWRLDRLVAKLERDRERCDDTEMSIIAVRRRLGLSIPHRSDWSPAATRSLR